MTFTPMFRIINVFSGAVVSQTDELEIAESMLDMFGRDRVRIERFMRYDPNHKLVK